MIALLSAVFGFAAPFLPEVLKLLRGWQDHRFEIDRMRLSAELAEKQHAWRMEEINTRGDIAEMQVLHKPVPSFGVQILDKAADSRMSQWLTGPVFLMFAFLDFAAGMVRPAVAYAAFAFYIAYKWAVFATLTGPRFEADAASAVRQLWTEQDWAVLTLVLSYWFGQRVAKRAGLARE